MNRLVYILFSSCDMQYLHNITRLMSFRLKYLMFTKNELHLVQLSLTNKLYDAEYRISIRKVELISMCYKIIYIKSCFVINYGDNTTEYLCTFSYVCVKYIIPLNRFDIQIGKYLFLFHNIIFRLHPVDKIVMAMKN